MAVIEAGGKDDWIWFHIPAGYLFAIGNPRADWMFETEPDAGLNGRKIAYPRGKVVGGSSAINAMIYMRGQAADYDHWRQLGLKGWGWSDVLPYFRRHEDHYGGRTDFHGYGGELKVDRPRVRWRLLDAFREAARETGIPSTDDFNKGNNEGCGYFEVNQKRGRRWSAASAFLKPALSRKNLTLITHAHVERVLIEGRAATGVVIRHKGATRTITAKREVIVSAGAVASPAILERSGIGDGERLQAMGVPVVQHLPGVGENLQDHLQLRCVYKVQGVRTMNVDYHSGLKRALIGLNYALRRRGALTMAPSQLGAFTRSNAYYDTPNLEFHIQPLSLEKFGDALHGFPAFTASVCNIRPTSRGSVHARSSRCRRSAAYRHQLSLHTGRPKGRGRCDHPDAAHRVRTCARPVQAGGIQAGRASDDAAGADARGRRHRHDDLSSGGYIENGRGQRCERGDRRDAEGQGHRPAACRRCVGHADDHIGQHQRADHDDRREGGRDDPGKVIWCRDRRRVPP